MDSTLMKNIAIKRI